MQTLIEQEAARSNVMRQHRLRELPILLLNLHENCNCRCLMCDIWKKPAGAEFALAELERHRESIAALRVREVVLTGGEPLLHSQFDALCAFLKSCGVKVTLLTTGLLLTKRAKSVAMLVDEVIVSLDGPEDVHNKIRGVRGGFGLIRDGVAAVRADAASIPIRARSTVQRANFAFLRGTVAAAIDLGLTSISFLAADLTSTAFNRELVWPVERQSEVGLTGEEVGLLGDEMESLITQHSQLIGQGYIVESPEKLRRIVRCFQEYLGELQPEAPLCNAPWVSAVLEVDGGIRPCFFHRKVGSASLHSLAEAINSDDAERFRGSLDVKSDATCKRCVCSLNYPNNAPGR